MNFNLREINYIKLFTFTEEQKKQIFKIYDKLCEIYNVSVIDIKDSPLFHFKPMIENPDFIPQICYLVDSENNSFYLYIVIRTIHYNRKYSARTQEFLEVWGIKELDENFEYISINKKKWTDKIAGIFSSFNINIKDDDFKDFYVLGSDQFKTKNFLSPKRKETIKLFPDKDFKLEIKNNILSFGLSKKLSLARALQISKFLKDI